MDDATLYGSLLGAAGVAGTGLLHLKRKRAAKVEAERVQVEVTKAAEAAHKALAEADKIARQEAAYLALEEALRVEAERLTRLAEALQLEADKIKLEANKLEAARIAREETERSIREEARCEVERVLLNEAAVTAAVKAAVEAQRTFEETTPVKETPDMTERATLARAHRELHGQGVQIEDAVLLVNVRTALRG